MKHEESMGKPQEGSESHEQEKLLWHAENNFARLEITKESLGRGDVVTIKDERDPQQIELNDFLPEGNRFIFVADSCRHSHYDYKNGFVTLSSKDLDFYGLSSLVIILHEVGHAVEYQKKPENIEKLAELDRIVLGTEDPAVFSEFYRLLSESERGAWAFAIKTLRSLVKELDIKMDDINLPLEEIKRIMERSLSSRKETAEGFASRFPESEKEKLLEEISKLFTRKDKSKEK